jgi:hypothetical protein
MKERASGRRCRVDLAVVVLADSDFLRPLRYTGSLISLPALQVQNDAQ